MSLDMLIEIIEDLSVEELLEGRAMLNRKIREVERERFKAQQVADQVILDSEGRPIEERRRHPRFHADFPCRLARHVGKTPGRSSFIDGRVVDISRGGARVVTRAKLLKGEPVTVYLQPSAGITKQVYAMIVRANRNEDGLVLGLKYIEYEELVVLSKRPVDVDDYDYDSFADNLGEGEEY